MQQLHCAICGKKEKTVILYKARFDKKNITPATFSARRTPDRMHYQFLNCLKCGLIFSSPIFNEKEIKTLYTGSTFDYGQESEYLKKTYGKYLQDTIKDVDGKQKLLDIGCGNGFFLEEALERGIADVWGIEPGKKSIKSARNDLKRRIINSLYKSTLFSPQTFSIITCFHTLDHIPDPNVFVKAVYNHLRKGGRALFIVHNTSGLSVKIFGESSPIFDIEHIYLFNKKTLQKLFEKHKFRSIQVFDVINTYPLRYWWRMVPLPKTIKSIFEKIITSSFLGNIPISIPAGNIGIIAEK